jgi:PAS domain S-box-containing protein
MSIPAAVARAILATSADAIVAADRDGVITFWNAGAERIFGFPPEVAISKSLDIIIPERLRPRHWDGYRRVMETGESRYGSGELLAVPAQKQDGTTISIEFTIAPLHDDEGNFDGLVALIRDVTGRFEELRSLRRRIAELTAVTARG